MGVTVGSVSCDMERREGGWGGKRRLCSSSLSLLFLSPYGCWDTMNKSSLALPEGDTREEEQEEEEQRAYYYAPFQVASNHPPPPPFRPSPFKTRNCGISPTVSGIAPVDRTSSSSSSSSSYHPFDGNPARSTSGLPFDRNSSPSSLLPFGRSPSRSTSSLPFDGNPAGVIGCSFDRNPAGANGCPFDGNPSRNRSCHPFDGNPSTSGRPFDGNPSTNGHPFDGNHPSRRRSSRPSEENSSASGRLFNGNLGTGSDRLFDGNPSTSGRPFDENPSICRSSHPSKDNPSRSSLSIDSNPSTSDHLLNSRRNPSRSRSGHFSQENSSRSSGSCLFDGNSSTSSHLFDGNLSGSRSSHLSQENSSRSSSRLFDSNSSTSSHLFDGNTSRSNSRSGHISKGNSIRSSHLFDRDSSGNGHFLDRSLSKSSHLFDGNSSRSGHLFDRDSSRSSLPLNGNSSRSSHLLDGNLSRSSSSTITRLSTTDILKSQPERTRVQESSSSSGKGRNPSPSPSPNPNPNPSTNLNDRNREGRNPSANPSTNLSDKSRKERNHSTNLNDIARLPTADILKSQTTRTNPSLSSNSNPSTIPSPSIDPNPNPNSNPLKFLIRKFSFGDPVVKDSANLPGRPEEDCYAFLDPSSTSIFSDRVTEKTAMDSNKRNSRLESEPSVLAKNAFLVGLYNQGNTCYLNSCLQCLAHTRPLVLSIIGTSPQFARKTECMQKYKEKYCTNSSTLAEALASSFWQLIKDLSVKPPYSVASAADFLRRLQAWAPQFSGYQQQDAQEVLRAILDGLHEALNKAKLRGTPKYQDVYKDHEFKSEAELAEIAWSYHKAWNDSVIQDIFCGQLQSTIVCSVCQRKSHCFDPFLDLSLPLPNHGTVSSEHFRSSDQWRVTIQDCLSLFMAPEMLSGSNKYHCPSCKASQICTKQLSIYRTPLILVLHLKRFYGSGLHSFRKDDTPVSYPIKGLDLTKFLWRAPTITGGLTQNAVYDLYATCNHSGSISSGHYTAQCKNTDDKCYSFNDSDVKIVQDSTIVTSSAYILFYQQRRC